MENSPPPGQKIGKYMLILVWIIAFVGLTLFFGNWEKKQYNPNTDPRSQKDGISTSVTLKRNRFQHYIASGKINGSQVIFLLDTGATDVVVPAGLAAKLGLEKGREGLVQTANGTVTVWKTRLESLELGSIKLYDVRAAINPGMDGQEVLLGMSALKHLEFTQSGDTLTIRQIN